MGNRSFCCLAGIFERYQVWRAMKFCVLGLRKFFDVGIGTFCFVRFVLLAGIGLRRRLADWCGRGSAAFSQCFTPLSQRCSGLCWALFAAFDLVMFSELCGALLDCGLEPELPNLFGLGVGERRSHHPPFSPPLPSHASSRPFPVQATDMRPN